MAEDKKNDLTDMTAAEYLLSLSDIYDFSARGSRTNGGVGVGAALVPANPELPEVSVSSSLDPDFKKSSLSVGSDALRYSRQYQDGGDGSGGPTIRDTVEGGMGPVRGFYQQYSQPGSQELRGRSYGANVELSSLGLPVELYAKRDTSSQDVIEPEYSQYFNDPRYSSTTDVLGASGSLPVGSGTLSGGINRQFQSSLFPQQVNQASRPTAQSPTVTNYSLGYGGKVGSGQLGVGGNLRDVRGVGMEPSVRASYNYPNPFGFGGNFNATGSYNNPIGDKSAAEALMRYKVNF